MKLLNRIGVLESGFGRAAGVYGPNWKNGFLLGTVGIELGTSFFLRCTLTSRWFVGLGTVFGVDRDGLNFKGVLHNFIGSSGMAHCELKVFFSS